MLINDPAFPESEFSEELSAGDIREALTGLIQVVALIGAAIAFSMWIHRAYRNLPALGATAGLSYTPAWAVGYFYIPILNLFRPYQATKEIWRASDPNIADAGVAWERAPGSSLLVTWWAVWILSNLIDNASFRLFMRADTVGEIQAAHWVSLAANAISIPAAIAAIGVVLAIDKRQDQKARKLGLLSEPEVHGY